MNATPAARAQPGLWRHLWLWALGAIWAVWLILLALAWSTSLRETRQFMDGHLVAVAQLWLSDAHWEQDSALVSHPELRRTEHEYAQDVAVIAWEDGHLITDSHGLDGGLDRVVQLPQDGMRTLDITDAKGEAHQWRAYVQTARLDGHERRVAALINMRHSRQLAADIAKHLAEPVLLLLPLAALVLWWTIRRGLRPLDRLSSEVAALDGFAGQRLDERHRFREFTSTVTAINTLVDTLQTRAQREREFASDVAHELRTPLSVIALQARAAQAEPSAERLQLLEQEALRGGRILSQLLDLARAQRSSVESEPVATDLAVVAGAVIASHAQQAYESHHELSLVPCDPSVTVRVPTMLLELALRNLIENALRHTPPGTQVQVRVWQNPQACGVSVSDDGQRAGAPAVETAKTHGLGLGLRLVERMAEQMGAEPVRDTGESPMTTRFTLRWRR